LKKQRTGTNVHEGEKETRNTFSRISHFQHERGKLISEISFVRNWLTLLTFFISSIGQGHV
jgi:hypothetical protein